MAVSSDTTVRGVRILAILLLVYAVVQFWHEYYHWSGAYSLSSQTSVGSTYFHWDELWSQAGSVLDGYLGWVRASLLALVLYMFIRGRAYWRRLAIGVPAAIVLAGFAMGLGVFFGLAAVGNEIGSVASEVASVASEIGNVARAIERFGPIGVNVNQ